MELERKYRGSVVYVSTSRGHAVAEGYEAVYHGMVSRIPAAEMRNSSGELVPRSEGAFQKEMERVMPIIEARLAAFPEGTVEIFEAWDLETDDLLLMYRFPFRRKDYDEMKGSS